MKTMLLLITIALLCGCGETVPNVTDSYNTTTSTTNTNTTSTDADTTTTTTTTTDSGNTTAINLPPVVAPAE